MVDGKSKINIIYEDNHLLVVEKPINVPVQLDSSEDLDLLTMLKQYIKEKYNKPGEVYLGLVHRLDRPVGGIMVFAKTSKCASRLSEQIRENQMDKYYLAVVNGRLNKTEGVLEDYLFKDEKKGISMIVDKNKPGAKYAKLEYKVISENIKRDVSLVEIKLFTGRHHQIRLQFNRMGSSLYGDQRYGVQDQNQIALFAYKLGFKHPTKDEYLEFKCIPKYGIFTEFKVNL